MAKKLYCNKCGKEIDMQCTKNYFSVQHRLGYGSKYDGDWLDIDLCCDCVDELIEKCAISPIESIE